MAEIYRTSRDRRRRRPQHPVATADAARSGQKRQSTVARFADGEDAWLVVASAGGSAHHPAWDHNIAAHPGQVRIEFGAPPRCRGSRPGA